uniref:C2H2-type domain-containing protein n=1 Tax=Rhabditophanes sp. KR3021 TaxID=114890 RepID=A0AC35TIZ3_9BILA
MFTSSPTIPIMNFAQNTHQPTSTQQNNMFAALASATQASNSLLGNVGAPPAPYNANNLLAQFQFQHYFANLMQQTQGNMMAQAQGNMFQQFLNNNKLMGPAQQNNFGNLFGGRNLTPAANSEGRTSTDNNNDLSPPPAKKIHLDNDGTFACPICDERLRSNQEVKEHMAKEIVKLGEKVKAAKVGASLENIANFGPLDLDDESNKKKRELELVRIRLNREKRELPTIESRSSSAAEGSSSFVKQVVSSDCSASASRCSSSGALTSSGKSTGEGCSKYILNNIINQKKGHHCKRCMETVEFLVLSDPSLDPCCITCYKKKGGEEVVNEMSSETVTDVSSIASEPTVTKEADEPSNDLAL